MLVPFLCLASGAMPILRFHSITNGELMELYPLCIRHYGEPRPDDVSLQEPAHCRGQLALATEGSRAQNAASQGVGQSLRCMGGMVGMEPGSFCGGDIYRVVGTLQIENTNSLLQLP